MKLYQGYYYWHEDKKVYGNHDHDEGHGEYKK